MLSCKRHTGGMQQGVAGDETLRKNPSAYLRSWRPGADQLLKHPVTSTCDAWPREELSQEKLMGPWPRCMSIVAPRMAAALVKETSRHRLQLRCKLPWVEPRAI